MERAIYLEGRLRVTTGDITRFTADAVVNAANSSLMGGGGVDGAIHRTGGPEILRECKQIRERRYPDGLPAGGAVATTAGRLPARYVIHTVGPVYRGGHSGEAGVLASAYRESLKRASELGCRTVAFPAISTGIYGYPKGEAAVVAYAAIRDFLAESDVPQQVFLVFWNEADASVFVSAIGEKQPKGPS